MAEITIAACDVTGQTVSRDAQTISPSTTDMAMQTNLIHLVHLQPQGEEKPFQAIRLNQGGQVELATTENSELLNWEQSEQPPPPIIEGAVTEGVDTNNTQWQELAPAAVVIMPKVTQEMAKVMCENEICQTAVMQQYPLVAAMVQADLSEPPIE